MPGDLATTDPYHIHDVLIKQVPSFDMRGNSHQVTQVSIFVGIHGPFTEQFGPGRKRPDTPEAITQWKSEVISRVMAGGGGQ